MGLLTLALLAVSPPCVAQDASATPVLSRYDLGDEDVPRLRLSRSLEEVSGLTFDARGRLFAHQDESADVFELDPRTGDVVGRYRAGRREIAGDFEGIAAAGSSLFMVDSDGLILEYRRGGDGSLVSFLGTPTGLGERCEVEGLAYDPRRRELLLPCKEPRSAELEDRIAIFAFSLDGRFLDPEPRVLVAVEALAALGLGDRFRPSALEVDPGTGHLLLASGPDHALLELGADGRPVVGFRLSGSRFRQVEGLALGPEGDLYLASEGDGGRARLTRFAHVPPHEPLP